MSAKSTKDRHQELLDELDRDDDEPSGGGSASTGGRASPDNSVPALGTAGELLRDELRSERAQRERLEAIVEELESKPAERRIPARLICHGRFRDRHDLGFADKAFDELKASIQEEKGNHAPVLVRPLSAPNADGCEFEVVWGHRRHRACLELDLDVSVLVRELTDREAVQLMTIENKHREGLSQFELARKYRAWLEAGLFKEHQEIAQAEHLSKAAMSRIMSINEVPAEVLDRVADPRKVTGLWASKVLPLLNGDAAARKKALARLSGAEGKLTPKEALDLLMPPVVLEPRDITVGDRRVFQAIPQTDKEGAVRWASLRLYIPLSDEKLEKLAAYAAKL